MRTIILLALAATLGFFGQNLQAQEENNQNPENTFDYKNEIKLLEQEKENIYQEEKFELRQEVIRIDKRLEEGEITDPEAETLKKAAAEKAALNIENKTAIIDNKIALLQRNKTYESISEENRGGSFIQFGNVFSIGSNDHKKMHKRKRKYDRRTTSDFVFAFGLNNTIIDGKGIDDSPYKIGGSRFAELGWAWKTRVFKNTAWLRFKYGFSFQFNGLKPTDDRLFVEDGNQTVLQEFDGNLDKSKFRMDNLVIPLHFEFGPYKKRQGEDYVRYSTHNRFKLGIGGYAGLNLGTRQKLKFDREGDAIKEKQKADFNTNNFVYGLSSYVAWGGTALYVKYDLNPIFKDNPVEQRNISLGVRFDMD